MTATTKLLYSRGSLAPLVHIGDSPPADHEILFCGIPRTDVEDRVYCTYADSLPGGYILCPGCFKELKHRIVELRIIFQSG